MRLKTAFCIAVALLSSTGLFAQKSMKYFVSAQGGAAFSMNENFHAYFAEGRAGELFTSEGSIAVGTYFNERYGARLSFEYSNNVGAANYQESFKVFRPYKFRSAIGFADFIVNAGDISKPKTFNCRFFAGLGYAYSFDFDEKIGELWWLGTIKPAHSFGMRAGMILEFVIPGDIGFFFEPCFEMFTDRYNGIDPSDGTTGLKYGFPFDCKINNSIGVTFHF